MPTQFNQYNKITTDVLFSSSFQGDTTATLGVDDSFEFNHSIKIALVSAFLATAPMSVSGTTFNNASCGFNNFGTRANRIEAFNVRKKEKEYGIDYGFICQDKNSTEVESIPDVSSFAQHHFKILNQKIIEISRLGPNWDDYGGVPATPRIISKTKEFIENLPYGYIKYLDIEDGVFLNSHGTITIEWRPNTHEVISVEIGHTTLNYYAIINGEKIKSDSDHEIVSRISSKINSLLQKMFAKNYAATSVSC